VSQKQVVWVCIVIMLLLVAWGTQNAAAQEKSVADAAIAAKVKTAINGDTGLSRMDISIEVYDGVVHLGGFVNSLADIARAEALARAVAGVTAVKSRMRLENRPTRAAVDHEVTL